MSRRLWQLILLSLWLVWPLLQGLIMWMPVKLMVSMSDISVEKKALERGEQTLLMKFYLKTLESTWLVTLLFDPPVSSFTCQCMPWCLAVKDEPKESLCLLWSSSLNTLKAPTFVLTSILFFIFTISLNVPGGVPWDFLSTVLFLCCSFDRHLAEL